jgi:hypothetical protein
VTLLCGKRRTGVESSRPCTPAVSPFRRGTGPPQSTLLEGATGSHEVIAVMFDRFVFNEQQASDWWKEHGDRVVQEIEAAMR